MVGNSFTLQREMELEGLDIPAEPALMSPAFQDFPRWVWDKLMLCSGGSRYF